MKRALMYVGVVMVSFIVMAGCQAMTGKTAGTNIDDTVITSSVKTKLAGENVSSLTRIDVDTDRGVVTLNGVVEASDMKGTAENLARQVDGVKRVVNNLQVQ